MRAEKISELPIPDPDDYPIDDPEEITVTLRRSEMPELGSARPKVLLVDTDPSMRKLGVRLLGRECKVETVDSAESAWSLLAEKSFHVVITERDLRDRDGIWLLRFVQRRHPTTRRILHTNGEGESIRDHLNSGVVQALVRKPASHTELITSISAEA